MIPLLRTAVMDLWYLPPLSQIYLSWKSGPAEVKHWKDMLARPRTNVAQWHSLKAWFRHPASFMATSCLLSPSSPSPLLTPVLMHKTDLLPGCKTRVQLAICSLKPLKSFLFQSLFLSDQSPLARALLWLSRVISRHFADSLRLSACLSVCLSASRYAPCLCLMFTRFVDSVVVNCSLWSSHGSSLLDWLKIPQI